MSVKKGGNFFLFLYKAELHVPVVFPRYYRWFSIELYLGISKFKVIMIRIWPIIVNI